MNTISSGETTPSPSSAPRKGALQGPCYLKMLVSNVVAGSIIGKSGAVIAGIEGTTQAALKLSSSSSFFPGTTDRVVVVSGEQDQINRALAIILEKVGEVGGGESPDNRADSNAASAMGQLVCKLVVPKTSVSGIIGKGGQQIRQLQLDSGAKVQISNRAGDGLSERVITIGGNLESIHRAAIQIATAIQDDTRLKDHMYVQYAPMAASGLSGVGGMMPVAGYGHYVGQGGFNAYPQVFPAAPQELMMEQCEISVEVPNTFMGFVIGKGGAHLNEIARSSGAQIKPSQKDEFVPGTQNRRVTIIGPMSAVHAAHARILMRMKEAGTATNPGQRGNNNNNMHQGVYSQAATAGYGHLGLPYGGQFGNYQPPPY